MSFSSLALAQQMHFGVSGLLGFNHGFGDTNDSDTANDIRLETKPEFGGLGFGLGFMGDYHFAAGNSLEFGVMWTQRVYKNELTATQISSGISIPGDVEFTVQQFEFPIIYNFHFAKNDKSYWQFGAGIVPKFGLGDIKTKIKLSSFEQSGNGSYKDNGIKSFAVRPAIQIGVSAQNYEKVQPFGNLRATVAVLKESDDNFSEDGSAKPIHIDFVVGMKF